MLEEVDNKLGQWCFWKKISKVWFQVQYLCKNERLSEAIKLCWIGRLSEIIKSWWKYKLMLNCKTMINIKLMTKYKTVEPKKY